jgi:hypothetical protein
VPQYTAGRAATLRVTDDEKLIVFICWYHPAPKVARHAERNDAGFLAEFGKGAGMDGAGFSMDVCAHVKLPVSRREL